MTILDDTKSFIGIPLDNDGFDAELLMLINSTFANLSQIGADEFNISVDDGTEWPVTPEQELVALSRHYTRLKVRLAFDTPASGAINQSLEASVAPLEGRMSLVVSERVVAP